MIKKSQYGAATQPQPPQQPPQQPVPQTTKRKIPGQGIWQGLQDTWQAFLEGADTKLTADEYYDLFLSKDQWCSKHDGTSDDWRRWKKRMESKMKDTGGPANWLFRSLGIR